MPLRRDNPGMADWESIGRYRSEAGATFAVELEPDHDYNVGSRTAAKKASVGMRPSHPRTDGPMLLLPEPLWVPYRTPAGGRKTERDGVWAVGTSLLSITGKMGCTSMSLPAGPIGAQGTCQMAKRRTTQALAMRSDPDSADAFRQELRLQFDAAPPTPIYNRRGELVAEGPPAYICDGCYAGKGHYDKIALNIWRMMWRLAWVNAALEQPHGFFVTQMVRALTHFYELPAKLQRSAGINGRYFRWHDAGDVYKPEYWDAIVEIAERLPRITFWMPTRQWAAPAWAERFRAQLPENLVVRPSALFVDGPAPILTEDSSLAAGTMVSRGPVGSLRPWVQEAHRSRPFQGPAVGIPADPRHPFAGERLFPERRLVPVRKDEVWDCPAYLGDTDKARSCLAQKCRVCWTRPDVAVSYNNH